MNMLSLFPAIPLLMMLGLWLSKSTRQIRAVMVAGSSLLLLLAAVLRSEEHTSELQSR